MELPMQWIIVMLVLIPCLGFALMKAVRFLQNLQRAGDSQSNQDSLQSAACIGCSGANRSPEELGIKLKPLVTLGVPKPAEQFEKSTLQSETPQPSADKQ
jgi:hypothetical protein